MITKTSVLETLAEFPEAIELERLIERLILLEKIEKGLAQSQAGQTMSMEEARRQIFIPA
jgi:hypothetical protein